jgi:hypothetical protein
VRLAVRDIPPGATPNVTAALRVNATSMRRNCIESVFDIASGDLSLLGRVD